MKRLAVMLGLLVMILPPAPSRASGSLSAVIQMISPYAAVALPGTGFTYQGEPFVLLGGQGQVLNGVTTAPEPQCIGDTCVEVWKYASGDVFLGAFPIFYDGELDVVSIGISFEGRAIGGLLFGGGCGAFWFSGPGNGDVCASFQGRTVVLT
jgi:hypothetical protein